MSRLPVYLLLLTLAASTGLSACFEFKKSAEYHDIVADYDYLKGQIINTQTKQQRLVKIKKVSPPKPVIRSNCDTLLRDLSQPNAHIIWCIPKAMR